MMVNSSATFDAVNRQWIRMQINAKRNAIFHRHIRNVMYNRNTVANNVSEVYGKASLSITTLDS